MKSGRSYKPAELRKSLPKEMQDKITQQPTGLFLQGHRNPNFLNARELSEALDILEQENFIST